MPRPSYADLLRRTDAPPGSAWGVHGSVDDLGSIINLTPESVLRGVATVHRGVRFNLDYPINAFSPPLSPTRHLAQHHIFSRDPRVQRDDYLDSFYLQATSQIDGLRHQRHPDHGFYNFTGDDAIVEGRGPLGIDAWARSGIVGRGVLADVARYREHQGSPLDHDVGEAFGVELIERTLDYQKVNLEFGDVLLIRTGWAPVYLAATQAERVRLAADLKVAGLVQSRQTLEWLWDSGISLIAADNVAIEVLPPARDSPFAGPNDPGLMHPALIALLGLALGELWNLEDLALDCSRDHSYEFLLVSKPLNLPGGVGSTANAIAIK
jgi:hypothetical protein